LVHPWRWHVVGMWYDGINRKGKQNHLKMHDPLYVSAINWCACTYEWSTTTVQKWNIYIPTSPAIVVDETQRRASSFQVTHEATTDVTA
jgi:hypothetical protein